MKTFATLATLALASATLYTEDAGTDMSLNKNDHAKAFCAEGYKLVPSDTGTFHNSSSFDTGNGTANDGLTGANATTFETCEKCPGTETSAGGTSRSCHAVSNTWATCSHMGCQLEEVATKACAKHGSSNPSTDLAAGTPIVETECHNWTSTQVQRIKVFHHGHEQAGTSHTCKLSGSRADTNRACECQCKTATVSEQEGRDGPVSGTNAPTNKAPSESTMAELVASGASWVALGADIDGKVASDQFGKAVTLSADGQTMAIASGHAWYSSVGHVTIYSLVGSSWVQRGAVISGAAAKDTIGMALSLSADGLTLAIGGPAIGYNQGGAGEVLIYTWDASSWVQVGASISGESAKDWSGSALSLSADGQTVAIGACYNDAAGYNAGHVHIYTWGTSSWVQRGTDIYGKIAGEYFGNAISLSADGQTVAIGAVAGGKARIYTWGASSWVQRGADLVGSRPGYSEFGKAISLSADGQTVAVGEPRAYLFGSDIFADGRAVTSGRVNIYTWGTSSWVQRGASIYGEGNYDFSGSAVSLSDDGQTIAIGAYYNDEDDHTGSTGYDGVGHTRIFTWGASASSWVQAGLDIDGEYQGDHSGRAISLSGNGQTVAIGAVNNDGGAKDGGHVRVYSFK